MSNVSKNLSYIKGFWLTVDKISCIKLGKGVSMLLIEKWNSGYYYFFIKWDSLAARLDTHYKAWSYKKNKKIKMKSKKETWLERIQTFLVSGKSRLQEMYYKTCIAEKVLERGHFIFSTNDIMASLGG